MTFAKPSRKMNNEIVKFMRSTERKAKQLNTKYWKETGVHSGVLSNVGFSKDEINYYKHGYKKR